MSYALIQAEKRKRNKRGAGGEEKEKFSRFTWTFPEWQLLHYRRNTNCIWQALQTNAWRGLTSCFACKSFQGTCAIWKVHLVSVPEKALDYPLWSHISSQMYDIRSLAASTRTGSTQTSDTYPGMQRSLHTMFCCTDKKTLHSEARPLTAYPCGNVQKIWNKATSPGNNLQERSWGKIHLLELPYAQYHQ